MSHPIRYIVCSLLCTRTVPVIVVVCGCVAGVFIPNHMTTECMCHWQHQDGCVGSGCEFQMGLSWYHYTCKDCKCVKEQS